MKQLSVWLLVLAFASTAGTISAASAADAPKDRIIAMYFHRTERCPTCQKMGAYSEEAIKTGFVEELKAGKVQFLYINFEDPKNARLCRGYKVESPSLIIAKIVDNRVAAFQDMNDIWEHVTNKPTFLRYVQDGVKTYQE